MWDAFTWRCPCACGLQLKMTRHAGLDITALSSLCCTARLEAYGEIVARFVFTLWRFGGMAKV